MTETTKIYVKINKNEYLQIFGELPILINKIKVEKVTEKIFMKNLRSE
jgi:hypothetical protein